MATSSYAQMFDEIMRREMTGLLERVAKGEGLELSDLLGKYLPLDAKPVTELKKKKTTTAARKPTKVVTRPEDESSSGDGASSSKCNATTAKGKPCSLPPLVGKCVCRVHDAKQKKVVVPSSSTGPVKKPKVSAAKKKADQPKHDHPLDENVHEDCELCNTHGSALDDTDVDEEFEMVKSPVKSLRDRLMKLQSYDEEEED